MRLIVLVVFAWFRVCGAAGTREQIFDAYAQRRGVSVHSLRFMLDGERINPENTPKTVRGVALYAGLGFRV